MENTIILIKPYGLKKIGFQDLVIKAIIENGYTICGINKVELSGRSLENYFLLKSEEHKNYLMNGPVLAILLNGKNAIKFGREFKRRLRRELKLDNMKNMLKSTEPGNEFRLQLGLFFNNIMLITIYYTVISLLIILIINIASKQTDYLTINFL